MRIGDNVVLVSEWMGEMLVDLDNKTFASHAVPEQFISLWKEQFVLHAGRVAKMSRRK